MDQQSIRIPFVVRSIDLQVRQLLNRPFMCLMRARWDDVSHIDEGDETDIEAGLHYAGDQRSPGATVRAAVTVKKVGEHMTVTVTGLRVMTWAVIAPEVEDAETECHAAIADIEGIIGTLEISVFYREENLSQFSVSIEGEQFARLAAAAKSRIV